MHARTVDTLKSSPWLVSVDESDRVDGYAYAHRHRQREAYQRCVDVSVYVRDDRRRLGVRDALYRTLFKRVARLAYFQYFAGITLPNEASLALHRRLGFAPVGLPCSGL